MFDVEIASGIMSLPLKPEDLMQCERDLDIFLAAGDGEDEAFALASKAGVSSAK